MMFLRSSLKSLTSQISLTTLISLISLTFLPTLTSCDVHQFPSPKEEPGPDLPEETMNVPLNIVFDSPDFYLWEHYYDPMKGNIEELYPDVEVFEGYPGVTEKYDNTLGKGIIDVTIKAYLANNTSRLITEKTFSFDLNGDPYDRTLDIELPVDTQYELAVWTHFREHSEALPFYDTTDFNKVQIIGSNYKGNTDYRDGYSGLLRIDTYSEKIEPVTVIMTRPMGKFEFLTLDLSEFLDRETNRRSLATRASAEDYIVIISFPYYYPSSYSVWDDRLENSASGVSFRTRMTVTGETEASLGFEYVMLNNVSDSGVQTRVDIYDPSMTHVAGSTTLTIPVKRDHHTLLRGYFLSEDNEGNGGVGIDPGFSGDHNVIP